MSTLRDQACAAEQHATWQLPISSDLACTEFEQVIEVITKYLNQTGRQFAIMIESKVPFPCPFQALAL